MIITACPNCGSRHIYQGNISDGILSGYTTRYVCKQCGHIGMPVEFSDEKDYHEFFQSKQHQTKEQKKKEKQ